MKIHHCFILIFLLASCTNSKKKNQYAILKQRIEEGLDKEQEIRKMINNKKEFDNELNSKMGEIDSTNYLNVLKYLDEYGYPTISSNGKKLCDGVFYILQHNDLMTMEKYIGQLKKRAFEGEASKKHYAMMQDRILEHNNQKQIYGTQVAPRRNSSGYLTNEYYVWPIQNVEIVDSLRKEMGFTQSIKEYAEALDAEYNRNEQLPKKQ